MELLLFLVAFIAGVLSFLAPCTLPILPAYFAYASATQRGKIVINTLMFGLGLSLMFVLFGVFASSVGNVLLNFKKEIIYVFSALVITFGVLMLLEKSLNIFSLQKLREVDTGKGLLGSFLFGIIFSLSWSGCIGPILGFMLDMAASTETVFSGGMMLFLYGMGLITPLVFVSAFLDRLPKEGKFWKFLKGKEFSFTVGKRTFQIHSVNLISGVFFILLGLFLLIEIQFGVTKYFIPIFTDKIFFLQDILLRWNL